MPQTFNYPFTRILDNADWDPVIKPALREYFSTDNEEDTRKFMVVMGRLKRIIVVELISRLVEELGLGRGNEGLESNDTYLITIKTGNYQDAMDVFSKMRDIGIKIPPSGEYNRIEFPNPTYTTSRGTWTGTLEITCHRAGKARK